MQRSKKLFTNTLSNVIKERKFKDMLTELEKMDLNSKTFNEFALKLESHIDNLDNFVAGMYEEVAQEYRDIQAMINDIKKQISDPELWEKNPLKPIIERYHEIILNMADIMGYLGWLIKFYQVAIEKYEGTINFQLQNEVEYNKLKLEKEFFDKTIDRIMSAYENELNDRIRRIEDMVATSTRKIDLYDKKLSIYDEAIQNLNTKLLELLNMLSTTLPQNFVKAQQEELKELPKQLEVELPKEEEKPQQKKKQEQKKEQPKKKQQEEEDEDEDEDDEEDIEDLDSLLEELD